MQVIVISGKAQHGKDTTAGFLKDALEADGYPVLIAHYGDLVKYLRLSPKRIPRTEEYGWGGL